MHTLLLLAALSNQITFTTTQQGDIYTVIPQVTLNEPCVCQVQILSVRDGVGGQSHTQQKQTLSLPANQPIELSRLREGANKQVISSQADSLIKISRI
ncbi:curli assembly chaperone CsgC, partial [Salmonella enterica subsp. enterica serovar Corvallis]